MSNHSTSLNEIAYNVLNTVREGRSSNTENISLEQVKYAIKYYRSTFIRRDQFRNMNRYRQFEQDLGLLSVDLYDTSEDSSLPSTSLIIRTDNKIPEPIRLKNSEAITFIGCIDKFGKPFPLVDAQRAYWNQYGKYTSNDVDAFYKDGYVYLTNTEDIENINVRGIFEDPEAVHEFTRANGLDLYDDNSPFPMPIDMIEGITKGLINGEMKIIINSTHDDETNTKQDKE